MSALPGQPALDLITMERLRRRGHDAFRGDRRSAGCSARSMPTGRSHYWQRPRLRQGGQGQPDPGGARASAPRHRIPAYSVRAHGQKRLPQELTGIDEANRFAQGGSAPTQRPLRPRPRSKAGAPSQARDDILCPRTVDNRALQAPGAPLPADRHGAVEDGPPSRRHGPPAGPNWMPGADTKPTAAHRHRSTGSSEVAFSGPLEPRPSSAADQRLRPTGLQLNRKGVAIGRRTAGVAMGRGRNSFQFSSRQRRRGALGRCLRQGMLEAVQARRIIQRIRPRSARKTVLKCSQRRTTP